MNKKNLLLIATLVATNGVQSIPTMPGAATPNIIVTATQAVGAATMSLLSGAGIYTGYNKYTASQATQTQETLKKVQKQQREKQVVLALLGAIALYNVYAWLKPTKEIKHEIDAELLEANKEVQPAIQKLKNIKIAGVVNTHKNHCAQDLLDLAATLKKRGYTAQDIENTPGLKLTAPQRKFLIANL